MSAADRREAEKEENRLLDLGQAPGNALARGGLRALRAVLTRYGGAAGNLPVSGPWVDLGGWTCCHVGGGSSDHENGQQPANGEPTAGPRGGG